MSISQYLRTTGVPPAGGSRTQGLTLAGAEHLLAVPQRFQVLTPQNASGKGILLLFKALACELSLQASIKKKKIDCKMMPTEEKQKRSFLSKVVLF